MKSKKITDSARGEDCTFNIVGVCNYDPSTVVFCHLPFMESGMGMKVSDLSGAYGCSACHDAVDGRKHSHEYNDDKWFYAARAMMRTLHRLIDKGLVRV